MPGKPWNGATKPMVVLHTLEFNGWPQTWKWDSPSHFVYNPNTRELRQYISMDKAAYSLRHNAAEDDYLTIQVEMWGKAANVPIYDDNWYEGVAELVQWCHDTYGIPLEFADFSVMAAGEYAPQRMTWEQTNEFTGFLGHGHFGRGVDAHWDPGMLDIDKVKSYLQEDTMPTTQWHQMIDALFEGRPDQFQGDPNYWKDSVPEDSPEWVDFWNAFVRAIS